MIVPKHLIYLRQPFYAEFDLNLIVNSQVPNSSMSAGSKLDMAVNEGAQLTGFLASSISEYMLKLYACALDAHFQ